MLIRVFLYVAAINISPAFSALENVHRLDVSDVLDVPSLDEYVPCERGWYYFYYRCYKIGGRKISDRLSQERASARCATWEAYLVSIESEEEQEFVYHLLLQNKYDTWIGLKDPAEDGRWADGKILNYTNWSPISHRFENEMCVYMTLSPAYFNMWFQENCDRKYGYICKKYSSSKKRSPNPMFCTPEEGRGWKYGSSCYHVVTEEQSWQNAERHCENNYKGHLVTIRDNFEDVFLQTIVSDMHSELWIGIKMQSQLQQKWTSGWYVSYDRFDKEQTFKHGTCVARKTEEEWITIPCSRKLPFICEVNEESPPVLKPPPRGAHCPKKFDGWRDLGGEYCYHIETEKSANYLNATFECQRKGGQMVSLHSKEESDILKSFFQIYKYKIYIGLIRSHQEDEFVWSDGSAVDYENWNRHEPNNEEKNENCVEAVIFEFDEIINSMKWTQHRCDDHNNYICSVKKIVPSSSVVQETTSCENYCIASTSHLIGLIRQSPEAKRISGCTDT